MKYDKEIKYIGKSLYIKDAISMIKNNDIYEIRAIVNNKIVNDDYELKSGDIIKFQSKIHDS